MGKKRKPSKKFLIRKLDTIVSIIVRNRDKSCVLCGTRESLTAGHLFSRRNYATRWDLENVWCQCMGCNLKHNYNPWIFFKWFIKRFGEKKLEELELKHNQISHFKEFDLEELILKLQIHPDYKELRV